MSSKQQKYLEEIRSHIAESTRTLRLQRRWTQRELAEKIWLSQGRLSEIERGDGSFTAEQLLLLAQLFNVPLTHFAPRRQTSAAAHAVLQNALVRLGAPQLQESDDVLPSERLEEATRAVKEALVVGAPRLLVALAPVLVQQIDRVSLSRLWVELRELGLERRLPWLAENVLKAIRSQRAADVPNDVATRYRRAETTLQHWLEDARARMSAAQSIGEDLLDTTIRSAKTLKLARSDRSEISHQWGIVTELQPSHFAEALEAARGGDS
jgi:transcriptional regulator with XRE-family HTH domain